MEDAGSDSSPNDVCMELASEFRSSMLFRLNEQSLKLSQVARELGTTVQEAHRNADRLIQVGLIKKNSDGLLSVTAYGRAVIKQLASIKFLAKHKQYFEEHTLDTLPMKFVQRIGALSNCDVISGMVAVLERWKKMCRDSSANIREIMAQVPLELIETHASRLKQGVKFAYIVGENTTIPKRSSELLKKVDWESFVSKGIAERRMIETVQVSVIVTDDHAAVSFPNLKGEPDMNTMFFSKDHLFHEWCLDFFTYAWNASHEFDKSKLHEV